MAVDHLKNVVYKIQENRGSRGHLAPFGLAYGLSTLFDKPLRSMTDAFTPLYVSLGC